MESEPTTHTPLSTLARAIVCLVFKNLSWWAKAKGWIRLLVLDPDFSLLTPKFISLSSNLYSDLQTWASLYSVSPFGCPLATSKLHKPKSPFILSSHVPKLGPSHIVSFHSDGHHLPEAEIYNHSLLALVSPLPWWSLIFLIVLTCHCHYFTVKSPSLTCMIVVV